ncbi:uncharacterized protein EI90DRAFT_2905541 [Cantharellus anzutake]|uniref:uncharacterized protein n=1 Tax=Cantharellus anzutake TaxID=1750568 RepID=UPI0019064275|nr:uncharacterized protein EI90DRAFT_2905541 [Cantharellus anzutake]KAF8341301.1 hypothetical protein EI90DRAFT_2905541 [Cantharellus anzutake]
MVVKSLPQLRQLLRPYWRVLAWVPFGVLVVDHVGTLKTVSGRSMSPTLNPDTSKFADVVFVNRWIPQVTNKFSRGEVVVLKSPVNNELIVKRIIALEGDVVQTLPPYPDTLVRIPKGHAWVEGDEPFHSRDSNKFGPVSLSLIDSKVQFIIFPLTRLGPLPPSPRSTISRRRVTPSGLQRVPQTFERLEMGHDPVSSPPRTDIP